MVQNGDLISLNMAVDGNFSIGSLNLSSVNFVMAYQAASEVNGRVHSAEFTMGGTASLDLFNVINFKISLGHNGQPGPGDPGRHARVPELLDGCLD